MWNKKLAGIAVAGLAASLYLSVVPRQAAAAPVIANMPHKADGTRISGNQPVPKTMPKDVVTKTRFTQEAAAVPKPAAPAVPTVSRPSAPAAPLVSRPSVPAVQAAPKPVTPAVQTAVKPAAPVAVPRPSAPAVQAVPQPLTPAVQTAVKPAAPVAVPKPAAPAVQTAPQPLIPAAQTAVKPAAPAAVPKPAAPAVQAAPQPLTPAAQTAVKPAAPVAVPKPAAPAVQAAPQPVTPVAQTVAKPAVPVAVPKPAAPAVQAAPHPLTPAVQTVPKPVTPAVRGIPKPAVKADPGGPLPTKPPAWQRPKPAVKTVPEKPKRPESRDRKKEKVKSVYQVGDKGWKIKQAQQYLTKLGFDPGGTDGRFTKSTRKALRKFQKSSKLKETGNLDNATYEELRWRAEARFHGGNVASAKILKTAAQYRGVRYVFGGTTPSGFDCSGYVQFVFARHGIRLTRTADTQAREGKYVSRKALIPGDLVFFTTYEPGASHVGIYAGNNKFWNATSSRGIMLSDLTDSYWGPRYYTARRILAEK